MQELDILFRLFYRDWMKLQVMRYREGQEVDPNNPYTKNTHMMMEMAYWMSIPIGLTLLWLGIKGRVMWLKVWSVGLMVFGIGILVTEYLGLSWR